MSKIRFNLSIDENLKMQLEEQATATRRTLASLIEEAIEDLLAKLASKEKSA